jgi:subtilisin family serine protease
MLCVLTAWSAAAQTTRPAPTRIIVKPRAGVNAKEIAGMHARYGGHLHRKYPQMGGWEVVELPTPLNVDAVVERYRANALVESAEPDSLLRGLYAPNDPLFTDGTLWNLHNTGTGGEADADIDAPEAWDIHRDASGIIVAVIDTGVRYTHEDLAANTWRNSTEVPGNQLDDDGNGYVDDVHGINARLNTGDPMDDHGHGTHVAGIIGAVGGNGVGCVGAAFRVQIMGLKFLHTDLHGTVSDAIECIDYARAKGAKVINASWGHYTDYTSVALYDAIARARDAGIIFVTAAGNDGMDNDTINFYPANYELDNIVVVAATTRYDVLAGFSHYGARTVDLGAPGLDVVSTWGGADDAYSSQNGTSMAAPHVAAACALLWARFPSLTYRQVIQRVFETVDPLPALNGNTLTGGRLNLRNALAWTNYPPVLNAIDDQAINAGEQLQFTATAVDPNGDALTFNLASGAPAGASISPTTGLFTWRPSDAQAPTTNWVTVRVSDNGSPPQMDSQAVMIVVSRPLRIINARTVGASSVALTWSTISGKKYQVQRKDSLNATTWSNVGGLITATGRTASLTNNVGLGGRRLFRVVETN